MLNSSLIPGKRYNVAFHISLADSMWYAVKNIGAYFSQGQPSSNMSVLLSYEPQVKYTGDEFLTNKESWTKIEGSFIAQGGENFITIGNFDNDANTDIVFVPGGGVDTPIEWAFAYYFIDDVSVTVDTTTGINEFEKIKFEVYPNPATNELHVSIEGGERSVLMFEMWTIVGQRIKSENLKPGFNTISVNELSSGIYHYSINVNDISKKSGKQVIIK